MDKKLRRNYLILIGLIILVICACFAFYNIYNIYQKDIIRKSPFSNDTVVEYSSLKNSLTESNTDTIVILSYSNNRDIYNAEKSIRKLLNKKSLLDNTIYVDVSEVMMEEDFIKLLNNDLNTDNKIKSLPALVYYKDGNVEYVVDSSKQLLTYNDVSKLIDIYELDE